jgi:phospholipase/lecithinase/hemolysin
LTPEFAGNSVDAEAVTAFNNEWSFDIAKLKASDPTLHFVPFDSYSFATSLINNAAAHGFTDTTDAWTTASASVPYSEASSDPNADKFFFYDEEHPTTYADAIIANKAYTELEAPEPSTLLLLTGGLLLETIGLFSPLSAKVVFALRGRCPV